MQQPDEAFLRQPPWSQQAEMAVLGALLQDNDVWDQVGDTVTSERLYAHAHRLIFEVISSLVSACKPADVVTVFEELQRRGQVQDVGGLEYLDSLVQYRISPANAQAYAQIVAERALLRGLASASNQIAELAYKDGELSVAQRLDQAQQALQAVQLHTGRRMPTLLALEVPRLLNRIQDRADGTTPPGISTGISGLDRMLGGGLKGGKQIILAARPSIGKTSLAQQIAISVSKGGYAAALLSQEMSKDDLVDRGAANLAMINLENIISGEISDDDWPKLTEAVDRIQRLPLYIDDQPALTLADIQAKARMLKREHDLKLLIVDYVQLCSGSAEKDNRHHQIEEISRGTKVLAKQLDVTVMLLSQLNREVEKRASGRPLLSDLKESGAIEEDADVVMLLSRNGDETDGFFSIHCEIPKNRQGKTGFLTLGFDAPHQRWDQMAKQPIFKRPPVKHYTEDI